MESSDDRRERESGAGVRSGPGSGGISYGTFQNGPWILGDDASGGRIIGCDGAEGAEGGADTGAGPGPGPGPRTEGSAGAGPGPGPGPGAGPEPSPELTGIPPGLGTARSSRSRIYPLLGPRFNGTRLKVHCSWFLVQ